MPNDVLFSSTIFAGVKVNRFVWFITAAATSEPTEQNNTEKEHHSIAIVDIIVTLVHQWRTIAYIQIERKREKNNHSVLWRRNENKT